MRRAPDFLFIGAARCASTWLHQCLNEHPDICVPRRPKELNYFNKEKNYARGLSSYLDFWDHCDEGQIRGEVTPTYLCHELSAERIHRAIHDAKLIACLRNPIDRTYSAYRGHVLTGRIDAGMSVAEAARRLTFDNQSGLIEHAYYHRHLSRFFSLFPRKQFLIYLFDEVRADPAEIIGRVYRFLGADDSFVPAMVREKVNRSFRLGSTGARFVRNLNLVGNRVKSTAPRLHRAFTMGVRLLRNRIVDAEATRVPPEVVAELIPIFREENEKLASLIGKDLSHWNRGADEYRHRVK